MSYNPSNMELMRNAARSIHQQAAELAQHKFKPGDKVEDNSGFRGTVVECCEYENLGRWYVVSLPGGRAVRYDQELTLVRE